MATVIPLGVGDWQSAAENVSRIRLRNMYLIANPLSPDGISRVTRPTLDLVDEIGDGPIYGTWRQDATLSGDALIVSGQELYRFSFTTGGATLIGALPGEGFCQFAGTTDRAIIVRDGTAYSTDGVAITVVVMPDDVPPYEETPAPVQSVACINSYFLLSVKDTYRFYWIIPGEADPDPLDFASAERTPDPILSINILTDEIWFIGSSGPEVWSTTPDPELPFQRINGRVYDEGCASRDTVAAGTSNSLPCLFWVTDSRAVVMAQGSVGKISDEAVEEKLKTATNLRAYSFRHNRSDFYVLTCDEFTYAYNILRKEWMRWDTYLKVNWLAHLGFMQNAQVYVGCAEDGRLWKMTEGLSDAGLPVIREISGHIDVADAATKCSLVTLRVNAGWSPAYFFAPKLELRWSEDQGATWSEYIQVSLGSKGQYNTDTIFRSLGLIRRPGRNFEIRFSELARFRIDYMTMN